MTFSTEDQWKATYAKQNIDDFKSILLETFPFITFFSLNPILNRNFKKKYQKNKFSEPWKKLNNIIIT